MKHLISCVTTLLTSEVVLPERHATVSESLRLLAEGWGSVFVVIVLMILVIAIMNKATKK